MTPPVLDKNAISHDRLWARIGSVLEIVESATSTNDLAWLHAENGASDGTIVFAEHQTKGRGRMGRPWYALSGTSVMTSVLLLNEKPDQIPLPGTLCLIAGIATARAVRESTGVAAQIAWPNDIIVDRKKLAGILIESRTLRDGRKACVIGIGINCLQQRSDFPTDVRDRATSIRQLSDTPVVRESIAGALLSELDGWLSNPLRWTDDEVCGAFKKLALPPGRTVRLRFGGREYVGEVEEVDPSAALVLRLPGGVRSVFPAVWTTVLDDDV